MQDYLKYLTKNNYSLNTIQTYQSILKLYLPKWQNISLIRQLLGSYQKQANTIKTHYAVLHSYMKFIKDKRIRLLEQYHLPHQPMIYRATFTKDYLYKKTSNLKDHKQALIRFLFETGLRVAELQQIIKITADTIIVRGKGNKIREVFHCQKTTKQITNWNISPKTIRLWVKKILGKQYSPHSIRRSHATYLLLKGVNPKMVMMQLGHARIETTYQYLQISKKTNKSLYQKHFLTS